MPLNDIKCKNIKSTDKTFKVSDEKGLYLEVNPSGAKYWRLKYRFAGKEKKLALGVYPEISLKEAREKRDDARKQIQEGVDPSQEKKLAKLTRLINADNSFENVAREWHDKQQARYTPKHYKAVLIPKSIYNTTY